MGTRRQSQTGEISICIFITNFREQWWQVIEQFSAAQQRHYILINLAHFTLHLTGSIRTKLGARQIIANLISDRRRATSLISFIWH